MDKIYLAALHYIGFTHKKLHKIFEKKQNYKEIFEKINYDFLKKNNFSDKQIRLILENYKKIKLDFLQKKLDSRDARIITFFCEDYPEKLKNIFNPPFLFYIRGKINNSPKISIIGSRKISNYGEKAIEEIIPDLVKYFGIISGGAAGCDTKAHRETLNNNGKTISIIGTGIDQDYPVGNEKLYEEISKGNGAVVSIFPIGEVGNPYNFPVRNEIVAGLSEGVLVVEAREKSGSLITSKLALDLGKDLFAIPGEIFKWGSKGTNNLIKNGEAKLVSNSNDILEEYNILNKKEEKLINLSFNDTLEENIYNQLILGDKNINELSDILITSSNTLANKISLLEIKGLIKKNIDGKYQIN